MRLAVTSEDLKPIIREVLSELLDHQSGERLLPDGRLGYSEPEAAALLGLPSHRLRDARLRGDIKARKVGRAYRYARAELVRFIEDVDAA